MTLTHSDQLDQIATALAKAQGAIEGAKKSALNPHFKSKYADLASVWDAIREPLSLHGLSIVQVPNSDGARIGVETILMHASGQWIKGVMSVTAKDEGPQAAGSCISYLRRYALQSFAGVAPEDDDGNAAEGRLNGQQARQPEPTIPAGYQDWIDDLRACADEGTDKLQAAWKASRADLRAYLTSAQPKVWDGIKARAASVPVAVTA